MQRRQVVCKDPVRITTQFYYDSQYPIDNVNQEIKALHAMKKMVPREITGDDWSVKGKPKKVVIVKVQPKSNGFMYEQTFGIQENLFSASSYDSSQEQSNGGKPSKQEIPDTN